MGKCIFQLLVSLAIASATLAQTPSDDDAFTVTEVRVDGNKQFKDNQVREFAGIETGRVYERYLFDYVLERGIQSIKSAYRDEGFEDAGVRWAFRDVRKGSRKLQFRVDEGPRARVRDVLLEGVSRDHYLPVRDNLGIEVGDNLANRVLDGGVREIEEYYGERGFARTVVTYTVDRTAGSVTFKVEEGRMFHVGEAIVMGNEKTRPRIATREVDEALKPDRLYRVSKIDASRANIYRTGLYRDLKIEAVDSERSSDLLDLLILVKEDKFKWYKVEPGYESPDRGALTLGWGHNNVMGNNQRLSAETSAAYGFGNREYRFSSALTYTEPWLFGYRYRGTSSVSYKRELWGKIRLWEIAVEPRVTKQLTDRIDLTGSFAYKRSNLEIPADAGTAEPSERIRVMTGPQHYGIIGLATTAEGRNDIFNPLRGFYLFGSNEVAGGIIPGTDFFRTVGDVRQYIRVGPAATVAARVRGGYARAYAETKDLPYQEKFFAGGAYSIRGWGEKMVGPLTPDGDPLGGNIILSGNVEFRFQFPFTAGRRVPGINLNLENFWAGFFVDGGNVWNQWEEAKKLGLVYGAGFGVRYNTPVGPLRVDYGRDVNANTNGKFYLAFGHVF